MNHRTLLVIVPSLAILAGACDAHPDSIDGRGPTPTTAAIAADPLVSTAGTRPPPPTSRTASPTCVNGWTSPAPSEGAYTVGVDVLARSLGTAAGIAIEDLRYFTGPDSPGLIEPHHEQVERWYIRARLPNDPSLGGRFLVVERGQSSGVDAVAPSTTQGWKSPDWSGFEGEGAPTTYAGLPGTWTGVRYDFVTGRQGPGKPGLPPETEGCLLGT